MRKRDREYERGQEGLVPLPDKQTFRPNRRDADPDKGPLAYVQPQQMVQDNGAQRDPVRWWKAPGSPASPTFTPGHVEPDVKEQRDISVPVQMGIKRT